MKWSNDQALLEEKSTCEKGSVWHIEACHDVLGEHRCLLHSRYLVIYNFNLIVHF